MMRLLHILGGIILWLAGVLVLGWVIGTFGGLIGMNRDQRKDGD